MNAIECTATFLQREPQPLDYLVVDWMGRYLSVASRLALSRIQHGVACNELCIVIVGAGVGPFRLSLYE